LQLVPANGKQGRAALQENEDQKQTNNVIKKWGSHSQREKNIKYNNMFVSQGGQL
jgi:hypothetical protein